MHHRGGVFAPRRRVAGVLVLGRGVLAEGGGVALVRLALVPGGLGDRRVDRVTTGGFGIGEAFVGLPDDVARLILGLVDGVAVRLVVANRCLLTRCLRRKAIPGTAPERAGVPCDPRLDRVCGGA